MFEYREATMDDLNALWDRSIAENPDDPRYLRWKKEFIDNNIAGNVKTFAVIHDGEPVGEGSLIFSPDHKAIRRQMDLADGVNNVNVNALRIREEFEGQGHISKMMRMMEDYARAHGYKNITIGVEAAESRNLGIYLHWGYDRFISSEMDGDALVLYYAKEL